MEKNKITLSSSFLAIAWTFNLGDNYSSKNEFLFTILLYHFLSLSWNIIFSKLLLMKSSFYLRTRVTTSSYCAFVQIRKGILTERKKSSSIVPFIWMRKKFTPFSVGLSEQGTRLISSVQFSRSVVSDSLWPHGLYVACQASLSITNSGSLPKLMSIESVLPSNQLILCHPLLLLPSIFPIIRVFSNESALRIRWTKYWSFNFSISPSSDHPGLISFRMDWLDLLAVQGTLKSLLQHHVQKHQFFGAPLSL